VSGSLLLFVLLVAAALAVLFVVMFFLGAKRAPTGPPAPGPSRMPPEVIAILARDRSAKIEAIRALRASCGCGLKDAKDAVEAWLAANPNPVAGSIAAQPSIAMPSAPPDGFPHTVEAILRADRTDKIGAIKAYREATASSLKDAKEAVEAWLDANPG
jgi:ribosomal protein L7/L12